MAYDFYTKSILHFDGADASTTMTDGTGRSWTAGGNAQLDTAQYKFGTSSLLLDGTGDYITTADSDDFNIGSNDFTVDMWVKRNTTTAGMYIAGQSDNLGNSRSISILFHPSTNAAHVYFYYDLLLAQAGSASALTDTTTWHHIAVVRYGGSLKVYLDGVGGTSTDISGLTAVDSTGSFSIGRLGDLATGTLYNGWIDEFRFSKGVARWTSDFTPPTSQYTEVTFIPRIMMIGD